MDITQFSDPQPFVSGFWSSNRIESPSLSDACTSGGAAAHSDEEVLLASSRPKKRAGRRIFKETRHPIFRGVRRRNNNKWVCELREPNKKTRIWLGTYPSPEMAARAHDVAALALRGKSACLNFADSAWRLPMPGSTEAKDIRRTASEAAEMFRPPEFGGDQLNRQIFGAEDSCGDECKSRQGKLWYVDDEEELSIRGLLAREAEEPILSPPRYMGDGMNWDDMESDFEVSLWSF